jgi:hypothetical protein
MVEQSDYMCGLAGEDQQQYGEKDGLQQNNRWHSGPVHFMPPFYEKTQCFVAPWKVYCSG